MPALALPLVLLAAIAPGQPPEVLMASAQVERSARRVVVRTVVSVPAEQAFDRGYRTTLRYRCGATWAVALRIGAARASTTLRWHYPARLAGRTCALQVRLAGRGGVTARSAGTVLL
jgi:hypothetical protein